MKEEFSEIVENLKAYKELSENPKTHKKLLKDKKIILYAATLLDHSDLVVVRLCLDILENFVANESAHVHLLSTFGVFEALESLSLRIRNKDEKIHKRATEITEILRNSAPPAFNTRNRQNTKKNTMFLLFVEDLNVKTRSKFEKTLVKIKGVISFLVDVELNRCTIRICPKTTIKDVINEIHSKCNMKALVITKNIQEGIETYCDVMDKTEQILNKSYLQCPETEYSPKMNAITAATSNFVKNGNGFLKSVVGFWNESFYW